MAIIDKTLFRKVEYELYNYQKHIKELNERREELLHYTPRPEIGGRSDGYISNPTELKGIKRAHLPESEQGKWLRIIHDSFQLLPREHKALVKYKYYDGLQNEIVAIRLHISRSLFYEWREDIILRIVLLATQRGLVKPIKEKAQKIRTHESA